MNNSGGCGVFLVLFLVFAVFGAGFLMAQGSQVALNNQNTSTALVEVTRANTALAAQASALEQENNRLRAEIAAANLSRQAAEIEQAKAIDARAKAEGSLAAANAMIQRLAGENSSLQARNAALEARVASIPITGVEEATRRLAQPLPLLGIALTGLTVGAAASYALARAGKAEHGRTAARYPSAYTFVKMTREEARQYARERARYSERA